MCYSNCALGPSKSICYNKDFVIAGFIIAGFISTYSEVSLGAGNRQKSPPTLSEFTSYCRLLCLYFHSK